MDVEERPFRISQLGDCALLLDGAGAVFHDACQLRIWTVANAMENVPGVLEAVPGMNNLMIVFDPLSADADHIERTLAERWQSGHSDAKAGRLIEVPTTYGGRVGEDLAELASAKGLSTRELVALHSQAIYTVAAVGAMPGFVYLSGLDPKLSTPRRSSPRMVVEKGSVIIGGSQAGIMPVTAPSGWHILGHTTTVLFDPERDPPATFRPGDRIQFVVERIVE